MIGIDTVELVALLRQLADEIESHASAPQQVNIRREQSTIDYERMGLYVEVIRTKSKPTTESEVQG